VVHGVRGLSGEHLDTISDVVRQETPVRRVGALGGPALSDDLLHGRPSVIVCGSLFPEVNEAFTAGFSSPSLRVYPTNDLRGLEWASALVGGLTIAIGYAQGIGMSAGLVAAFTSRSIGEASRIAAAAGGEEKTLLGLAGYGDLLASTGQDERPEVVLGRALAKGTKLADAMAAAKLRVEAVDLVPRIVAFADKHKVRAPIFKALAEGILGGKSVDAILRDLMSQPIEGNA
jgi:glycerol-3-phosphate dehydrogenase (NAD(P)+)